MRSCSRKYTQEQKGTIHFRKINDGAQIYITILFRHLFSLVPLQAVLFQKLQKFYFFPDLLNTTAQTFSSQLTDNCCKSQKGSAHVTVSNE